jgi:dephospho-CoA kinase
MLLFARILQKVTQMQSHYQEAAGNQEAFVFLRSTAEAAEDAREPIAGSETPRFTSAISLREVSFSYGREDILDRASMVLPAGKFIAIVGGSGAGKTTVADIFESLGAGIVDTDRVARDVVAPGQPGLEAVRREFGGGVILASGELDRRALRGVVFDDPAARRQLESLLHPLIRTRTLEALERMRTPYAVAVVPLLVETGFGELVDRVAVVDCPREIQLQRLVKRDGIDPGRAESMLRAQVDRQARLRAADDVIDNSGSLERLRDQVETLWRECCAASPR